MAHLESTQLFIVRTAGGSVYRGTLSTAETEKEKPVTIKVTETPGTESTIEQQQVVQIGEASDKFWQRFNGEVNVGTTYTKGNQTVQFTLGGAAEYLRERWSAEGSWYSSLANSSPSLPCFRMMMKIGDHTSPFPAATTEAGRTAKTSPALPWPCPEVLAPVP